VHLCLERTEPVGTTTSRNKNLVAIGASAQFDPACADMMQKLSDYDKAECLTKNFSAY